MATFIPGPELLLSPLGRVMTGGSDSELNGSGIELPERCDTVIIGSGLAGIAVATHLWHAGRRDFILVDPHCRPAAQFFERVDTLQQTVMRSPYEHHPGAEGYADCEMLDFARFNWHTLTSDERMQVRMAQSGQRSVVPLDIFRAFCARVSVMHEIPAKMVRAEVTALTSCPDGIVASTTGGQTKARQVIAAVGEVAVRAPAEWRLPADGPVSYWDHPGSVSDADRVAVIGSGLSAAHVIRLNLARGKQVIWVQRSQEKYQCADVDASYFRPEGRALYSRLGAPGRDKIISRQRRPSIMFEFSPGLREAEAAGQLVVHRNAGNMRVAAATERSATVLTESGADITADHAILAFGTRPAALPELWPHPNRRLAAEDIRIDDRSLKVADFGPLYVCGTWATQSLGPAARNIDGHRVAAQRICADILAGA